MILIEFRENDYLPAKQVFSSRGSCGHALQAIVLSKAYGAAFKYTVLDCQSTPSNLAFRIEPSVRDRRVDGRRLAQGGKTFIVRPGPRQ